MRWAAVFVACALHAQTAAELQAHVEFLASDLLEGRGDGQRGIEVAAEYIAAQFQLARLEPVNGSYFQNAEMLVLSQGRDAWRMTLENGAARIDVPWEQILGQPQQEMSLESRAIYKLAQGAELPARLDDRVVMTDQTSSGRFARTVLSRGALGILFVSAKTPPAFGLRGSRLVARDAPARLAISVFGDAAREFFAALPEGDTTARISARVKPESRPVLMRNVAGLLRGSDPDLRERYVMVSAHYDHLGIRGSGEGDRIYNGANDDASGTAAVIGIAHALASQMRPKRSILFIAFFGEEAGLVGSRFYGNRPLVPLAATVAQVNLEHLGRTDDVEGPRLNEVSVTGFNFSNVPDILAESGKPLGVAFTRHARYSDEFFDRSDNESLALQGVPAHTACVAFEFPDYHKPSDEAGKLDYANMEKVTRALAVGIEAIANRDRAPEWNPNDPGAERFRAVRASASQ